MNVTAPNTVAHHLLPRLVTLGAARKQARWQWANCADEDKHKWALVLAIMDSRLEQGEKLVGDLLGIRGFRMKREIVE